MQFVATIRPKIGPASAVLAAVLILSGVAFATQGESRTRSAGAGTGTDISWTTVAKPPYRTVEAAGGVINNKLYRFGGFRQETGFYNPQRSASVYDIETNKWSVLPDGPLGVTHSAHVIDGSRFILLGAVAMASDGTEVFGVNNVLSFDTTTNSWGTLPDLPQPRGSGGAALVGRDLHYFGGIDTARAEHSDHWVLNLDDVQSGWRDAPAFPVGRSHFATVSVGSGFYAIGGMTGWEKTTTERADVYYYDTVAKTWTRRADMPKALSHVGALETNGRIWTFGGEPAYPDSTSEIYVYNIASNTWEQAIARLPEARFAGIVTQSGYSIYYFDGSVYRDTAWKGTIEQDL